MKNWKFLLFSTVVLVLFIYSCQKTTSNGFDGVNKSNVKLENREENISFFGHIIPKGSNTYIQDEELIIELPTGYVYVGTTLDGQSIQTGTLGVRCICTEGSDCSPSKHTKGKKVTYTCIMGESCSTCSKNETSKSANNFGVEFEVSGLVNYNVGITFITNERIDQNDSFVLNSFVNMSSIHGNVFEEIFSLPKFKEFAKGLRLWFQDDNYESSSDYERYYFNIYGNICVTTMPKGYEIHSNGVDYMPLVYGSNSTDGGHVSDEDGVTCICHAGVSCKYKRKKIPFAGTFEWCDAEGCVDCELKD